jgi:integrase
MVVTVNQDSISHPEYLSLFMRSREAMGVSPGSLSFYRTKLGRFFLDLDPSKATRQDIETFLLQFCNPGNRHCYFRAIRTFYNWREENYNLPTPMKYMRAPRLPKLIMPALTKEQVLILIDKAGSIRDKSVIALFTESGLRLSELVGIQPYDIDWEDHTIRVIGKGRKEALAPFGKLTGVYLSQWMKTSSPNGNIWGVNAWGIESMLRRLEQETGITCNPHVFRRTFACLLRKAGLDVLTIKDLGRWESLEMVQRYTRTVTFRDSLRLYKSIL